MSSEEDDFVVERMRKRFRYKSFAERLKEVNVDVFHRVREVQPSLESENSSKLAECLFKWRSLDLTSEFKAFHQGIVKKSRTYKMVVYYQNDIIKSLQQYLKEEDTLALQSLLEVLVALSADLGPDFYPNFSTFFPILTKLLKTRDTQKLELVFVSISLLFRNLWRYMINDMENVLDLYTILLTSNQPSHIASFAAESVSFLLRKSKDHKFVLQKLFSVVHDHPKAVEGIGKVLFEMFKSSQGQFHSVTEKILPVMLQFVSERFAEEPLYDGACKCIEVALRLMAQHTTKHYASPVWNAIMHEIQHSTKTLKDLTYTVNLVSILNAWCETQQGSKLVNGKSLVTAFFNCDELLQSETGKKSSELYSSLCTLASTMIIAKKIELGIEDKQKILSSISANVISLECCLRLWKSLMQGPDFFNSYSKLFLKFCHVQIQHEKHQPAIIKLIVSVSLMNQSLPQDSSEVETFNPHSMDFSFTSSKSLLNPGDIVKNIIRNSSDWPYVWYSLVASFSIKPVDIQLKSSLFNLLQKIMLLQEPSNKELAVLSMTFLLSFKLYGNALFEQFHLEHFFPLLFKRHSSKHLLFILDILATNSPNAIVDLSDDDRNKLSCLFEENVLSSDSVLRRLTLSVLGHIDETNSMIYQGCLQAEDTPATIAGVRDKILKLSRLQTIKEMESSEQAKRIVISYLFSNFFVNFSPLWQPVQEIVCSYSAAKAKDVFWEILFNLLEEAPTRGFREKRSNDIENNTDSENALFHSILHGYVKPKHYASNERINYGNYRLLLWKTLFLLPNLNALRAHSKRFVDLFLQFLKNEFFQIDKHLASWEDIKNDETVSVKDDLGPIKKSNTVNLLSAMLKVFSRFSNLKLFPQSDYLLRLFKDFISHPDSNLQMLAFNCLLAFNDRVLVKHKEGLLSFIDEKKFRHAVVHFDVNELSTDDRPIIMPILLLILFGKMKSKEKMHSAGKAAPASRRSLVVRFLCNVSSEEMTMFAELLWKPYSHYLDSLGLSQTFNLESLKNESIIKLIPMRKQHGIISCIHVLIEECNQQLTLDTFSTLMTLLLQINAVNKIVMDKQALNRDPSRVSRVFHALQGIKRQSLECVLDMLRVYPSYLRRENVDALFTVHVWPDLPKLLHESSGKPNLLLKMLILFSENSAYLPLLAKRNPLTTVVDGFDCSSPLAAITSLLLSSKGSSDVKSCCVELLLSMLYGHGKEDLEEEIASETHEHLHLISEALGMCGEMSVDIKPEDLETRLQFGLAMILPHLNKVVTYYIMKMKRNRKGFLLPKRDLKFLSSVGDKVNDDSLLSDLTELLLGHITAAGTSHSSDGNELFIMSMQSLARVMRNTDHIVRISKLFSKFSEREHRLALVSILQSACQNDPAFAWTCEIVSGLNAWEKSSVNQMDYDAKLLAFRNISDRLKADDYDEIFDRNCELVLPILHCCLHTLLTNYADISLRESVHFVLELTIKRASDLFSLNFDYAFSTYQILIQQLILPSIETGLNSDVDDMRHDSVKLLSIVVAHFPNEPSLIGLDILRNDSNINDDTFDNLRHIQMHRRANAFRKVATLLRKQHIPCIPKSKSENKDADDEKMEEDPIESKPKQQITGRIISSNTARRYLLPLALQNLWNHRFKHIPYLREACIEVVKVCAQIMPWSVYRKMLIRTITGIKFPVTSFLVICSLLEIFPYDLSDYKWHDSKTTSAERSLTCDLVVKKGRKGKNKAVDQEEVLARNKLTAKEADSILSDVQRVILPNIFSILSVKDVKNPKQSKPDITFRSCERRLPYAKPVVLLLLKLPETVIKTSLPTVVLNVFAFLKHKDHDVRTAATKASISILRLLGSSYFVLMLQQLKATLCRGFQRHVLLYTVHMLLKCMGNAQVGMFDDALQVLLEIINDSLFGIVADEKMTQKMKEKLPEALGSNKAYAIYLKIATFIRKKDLTTLIEPLKNKLLETHNHDETKVVVHAFNRIIEGLLINKDFETQDLLIFVHGLISENISSLFPGKACETEKKKSETSRPESCYILVDMPKRVGERRVAKSSSTNIHVLVEFALNLLLGVLKGIDNLSSKQEYLEMLDPMVTYIAQCLSSTHNNTLGNAVDCVTQLFRAKLPSMSTHAKTIIANLFKIASDNSKGMGNQTQALACFKGLRVLCQSEYGEHISETQLKILLAYAEEDLYVSERQVQSFTLIKSIMIRGLKCKELLEVIEKVRNIAIQSQIKFMQEQARMIYIYFLKNYPMYPAVIEEHVEFILTHLSYEYEGGRMSALQLLSTIVTTFPEQLLNNNAALLFVPIAALMINDDSSTCRESAAAVIRFLLPRLKPETTEQLLISFALQWLSEKESILQQRLGAMLICIFAEVGNVGIDKHLPKILPVLLKNLQAAACNLTSDDDAKSTDQSLFHLLSSFLSILKKHKITRSTKLFDILIPLFDLVQSLLSHAHVWVQLICSQIFGCIFSEWDPKEISPATALSSSWFVAEDLEEKLLKLTRDFCEQLKSKGITDKLAEQVIKNLLFLARVFDNKHFLGLCPVEDQGSLPIHKGILLILRKARTIVVHEQTYAPRDTIKRVAILKFCAAFFLNVENPERVLHMILDPLSRGINASLLSGTFQPPRIMKLRQLSREVLEIIKSKVDQETFPQIYMKVTQIIARKQKERKDYRAQQVVKNPRVAAERKLKHHQKKKTVKRRKVVEKNPYMGRKKLKIAV